MPTTVRAYRRLRAPAHCRKLASGRVRSNVDTDPRRTARLRRSTTCRSLPRRGRAPGVTVARYYDPQTAQFLTRDPLEAVTRSPYGYTNGQPLDASDPSGLFCLIGHNSDGSCRGADFAADAGATWTGYVDSLLPTKWVRDQLGIDSGVECTDAYRSIMGLMWGNPPPNARYGMVPWGPGRGAAVDRNLFELPRSARTTMNEQYVFQRLASYNGISPETASARLHVIKAGNSLGGADNVVFDMSGGVYNAQTGEYLGSLTQGGR